MNVEIARLQIIGLKPDLQDVIHRLHRLGTVQISTVKTETDGIGPLESTPEGSSVLESLRLHLSHVRGLLDEFAIAGGDASVESEQVPSLKVIQSQVTDLRDEVEELLYRRERLERSKQVLPRLLETLRQLLPLMPNQVSEENSAWFGLIIEAGHREVVAMVEEEINRRTEGRATTAHRELEDEDVAMLIASPREFTEGIVDLLDEEELTRLRLPPDLRYHSPDEAIHSLKRHLDDLPGEIQRIQSNLDDLNEEWTGKLLLWKDLLVDEISRREVLNHLAETRHAFILEGWIPATEFDDVRHALHQDIGDKLSIEQISIPDHLQEEIPVLMDNPTPAQPFEKLVTFLNTPRYHGVDPTILMALFMPMIFGMILGDAGYGLLLLGLSFYLRTRLDRGLMRAFATMLLYGAGWSVAFGLLYGEVFGTLGPALGLEPLLFHRDDPEHLLDLLLLTVGAGTVHVLIGLLVGVVRGFKEGDRGDMMEHGGQLIGLIALLSVVGVLANVLPAGFMTAGIAGLIVGLVILVASLGWTGVAIAPVELVGLVGNVLSYLRIAAIGLASVYLAVVANQIAGALGSLIVGVIVAVLLHALNLLLGAFSPTIHSLRLHYVEFFGQFYEGGGQPFDPFSAQSQFEISTEEFS